MPDHPGLLAHGNVRLVILVGLRPIVGRIVAARQRFPGEIVRLAAALVDEIGSKIEPPLVAGQAVELDEGKLDFLVTAIAALLSRAVPKVAAMWST